MKGTRSRSFHPWTSEHVDFLISTHTTLLARDQAEHLGKSCASVYHQRWKLYRQGRLSPQAQRYWNRVPHVVLTCLGCGKRKEYTPSGLPRSRREGSYYCRHCRPRKPGTRSRVVDMALSGSYTTQTAIAGQAGITRERVRQLLQSEGIVLNRRGNRDGRGDKKT